MFNSGRSRFNVRSPVENFDENPQHERRANNELISIAPDRVIDPFYCNQRRVNCEAVSLEEMSDHLWTDLLK